MSWIVMLYDTYNNVNINSSKGPLPIAHSTQNAEVEVTIDIRSNFVSSRVVLEDKQTLIPCSESSATRSGKNPVPHPLHDKLQYVAGDYSKYGGLKGDGFHKDYMDNLNEWCTSKYSNKKVCALFNYLKKGCLIDDLVKDGTLYAHEHKLVEKWTGSRNDIPSIFKAVIGNQSDAFVRFCVIGEDEKPSLWQDPQVQIDYINYYLSKQKEKNLCYVTGEVVPCSSNHPSKIRHTGDKAKLISANDDSGFTYRGRFNSSEDAVQISYEVSQKAHNALKWLIDKQGKRFGDKVFLLWGTEDQSLPCLIGDTIDEAFLFQDETPNEDILNYTKEEIARRFNLAISGYKAEINSMTDLALIGLDSATTGRLSVTFYREFHGKHGNELFDRIKAWHEGCAWIHRYKRFNGKIITFEGCPALEDIANAAYGTEQNNGIIANEKVVGATVERLIPCITDSAMIPNDIVQALVRKSMHPQNYKESYNWYKVLSITCSIFKKHRLERTNSKEVWNVSVDEHSQDIVYNCGRLLAVADAIERYSLLQQKEKRETNAVRLFTRFSANPCKTWRDINDKLIPHIVRLGNKGNKLRQLKDEISALIDPEQFYQLRNLDGRMVLGFDAQRNDILNNIIKKEAGGEKDESIEEQD